MEPLKVMLPSFQPTYMGSMSYAAASQKQSATPELSSSQWANTVNAMAPFLDAEALRRALTILDTAIYNVQRAKALDGISMQTAAGGDQFLHFQNAAMYGMLQAQVQQEQLLLYQELLQLPCKERSTPKLSTQASSAPSLPIPAASAPGSTSLPTAPSPGGSVVGGASPASRRRAPQTLSTSLQILEEADPDCLLIVRRISKLGFKATRALKKHFSAYGGVVKVLLAHSTARQYQDQQFHVKRRPSNLGFIQMATPEAVKQILAFGSSQEIEGVSICVQRFEKNGEAEGEAEGDVMDGGEAQAVGKKERGMSMSEASTTASDYSPKTIPLCGM